MISSSVNPALAKFCQGKEVSIINNETKFGEIANQTPFAKSRCVVANFVTSIETLRYKNPDPDLQQVYILNGITLRLLRGVRLSIPASVYLNDCTVLGEVVPTTYSTVESALYYTHGNVIRSENADVSRY